MGTCRKFLRREKVKKFKLKELKLIIVIISNPCLKSQTHSFNKMEQIRGALATKLQGIERYNPENITLLESYVDAQVRENGYDLEANLALLKLYQFNSGLFNANAVFMIMVKALTNLPHTDFDLCKSLLPLDFLDSNPTVKNILEMAELLETCKFKQFWERVKQEGCKEITDPIVGFEDSVRKFVCHTISITYQRIPEETLYELLGLSNEPEVEKWISRNNWKSDAQAGYVLVCSQDESIKTKKITEKIDLESVAQIMASAI